MPSSRRPVVRALPGLLPESATVSVVSMPLVRALPGPLPGSGTVAVVSTPVGQSVAWTVAWIRHRCRRLDAHWSERCLDCCLDPAPLPSSRRLLVRALPGPLPGSGTVAVVSTPIGQSVPGPLPAWIQHRSRRLDAHWSKRCLYCCLDPASLPSSRRPLAKSLPELLPGSGTVCVVADTKNPNIYTSGLVTKLHTTIPNNISRVLY